MTIQENFSLLSYNTFQMDVQARWFAEYTTREELQELLQSPLLIENPILQIGGGSNLLFTSDFPGVILHSQIQELALVKEDQQSVWLRAGSGVVWDHLCCYAVEHGYGGLENLSGIPGEVGASAVQNVGAYGVEACDLIDSVETVAVATGQERTFMQAECDYGYRHSIFKNELKGNYIVTAVTYKLSKTPTYRLDYGNLAQELENYPEISLQTVREAVNAIRFSKLPDPEVVGNAGSFFMNPVIGEAHYAQLKQTYPHMPHYPAGAGMVKVPAAWLIDQCGWKGKQWGGAAVHDKQCLVIINQNHATACEVQELARQIGDSVRVRFNIIIKPEVNYV